MGCFQYKRMTRMTYQSCTINKLKHLYILHSFTSQNNFKAKPHFVFHCFTKKQTQWDFIFTPGTNLLRKFRKFQGFLVSQTTESQFTSRPWRFDSQAALAGGNLGVCNFRVGLGGSKKNGRLEWKYVKITSVKQSPTCTVVLVGFALVLFLNPLKG